MRVLLDTDICIYAINRKRSEVLARVRHYRIGEEGLSATTYAELRFGVENTARVEENMERLERFLLPLEVVPFDANAGRHQGRLRLELNRTGCPIGSNDYLIAAHATSCASSGGAEQHAAGPRGADRRGATAPQQPQQPPATFSPQPNPSPRWRERLSSRLCKLFLNRPLATLLG